MNNEKGDPWTAEHLISPAWGTDLILRKKDIIDDIRVHLTDIRDNAVVTDIDDMICWEYNGIIWIEDKYTTLTFHIAAQKKVLESENTANIPGPIRTMMEHKLKELLNRKSFLEELIKTGISTDTTSWTKLDTLMNNTLK